MRNRKVPILVYHHVYPEGAPELETASFESGAGIIGVDAFRRQLGCLADGGWMTVSTSAIVDWLSGNGELPERCVALHFDNGWLDTATVTLPLLSELGMTATCFPITDAVEGAAAGRSTSVRTLTEGVVEKPFMTWDQTQALLAAGWEIGAHTATHCKVGDVQEKEGDAAVMREAETSNATFEQRLGFVPSHFAYPSGSRNDRTDELLADCYRSLRLWHFDWPIEWSFTHAGTSPLAVDCQNVDMRVSQDDFERILVEAEA